MVYKTITTSLSERDYKVLRPYRISVILKIAAETLRCSDGDNFDERFKDKFKKLLVGDDE